MNYYSLFIIIGSIIVVVYCALQKTIREGLTNNDKIILIGDSVLENSKYITSDKSVFNILKTKIQNVHDYATDGATIVECYSQLDKIPIELDSPNTYIFISVGGNNLLNAPNSSESTVDELFKKLTTFIQTVQTKFPNSKIRVLNLYLPFNPRYKSYKNAIDQWNQYLVENKNKLKYNVVDINTLLIQQSDFVYDIEPSESGAEKIADAIYATR